MAEREDEFISIFL